MFSRAEFVAGLSMVTHAARTGNVGEVRELAQTHPALAAPQVSDATSVLNGGIAQTGTPARLFAISSNSAVRDAASTDYKPRQVAAKSATTALSIFPYYFNAPPQMFNGRTKKKGTVSFAVAQSATAGENPSPLSWSHTSLIIDPSVMADAIGDQFVRSVPLGGLDVTSMKSIPTPSGSVFYSSNLRFLLDAHPFWERQARELLSRANILINTPIVGASAKYFAIPASSATALQIADQALQLLDVASGGDPDKVEELLGYANSSAVAWNLTGDADLLHAPGAITVPSGFQAWAMVPDLLGNQFLSACGHSGLILGASGQLLTTNSNHAIDAAISALPYVTFATQVTP